MPTRKQHDAARVAALREQFEAAPLDELLSREVIAAGLRYSCSFLELLARRGNGPKFLKVGHRVLYEKAAALAWLASRTRVCASTSDPAYLEAVRLARGATAAAHAA